MARVVIADDDPETLALMRAALAPLGAEIREAASGVELLETIAFAGPFDLVITDLTMPHLGGAQVLAMARSAGVSTPFVIVTGARVEPDSAPWLGDATLVRKPFPLSVLFHAAVSLLRLAAFTRAG